MGEHTVEKDATVVEKGRACDRCGQSAPEGVALLSIWWADYECCSMRCAMLAEGERRPSDD